MMNKKRTIRVMCVDDHLFLIDGLKARFMTQSDFEFVGSLPTADDLVDEAMRLQADIVLVDIEMAGQDPFVSIDDLRRRYPDARAIILSAYVRDHYISAALKAGAWGYFSKSDSPMEIMAGIREVTDGNFAFGQKVQERCEGIKAVQKGNVKPPRSRLENLSPRELEVLRLIGRGMTRSAIAQLLCRSPKTIDGHRESIMEKLDIHDRGELLRFAIREGLTEA